MLITLRCTPRDATGASSCRLRPVDVLAQQVQKAPGKRVEVRSADAAYTGEDAAALAQEQGAHLVAITRPEASKGFVLLPQRWVVERSFAWASRFRRLAHNDERLPSTLVGLRFAAFVCLLLPKLRS